MSVAQHAPLSQWQVVDDCLVVGGIDLPALAQRVGRTPFYAYDRRLIDERVALLRAQLPPRVQLFYAVKANPMPELVRHMVQLVDGVDVASEGELQTALDAGVDVDRVSFAGPGKLESELVAAAAAGILISVESFREISTLARIARELRNAPRIAIRINPPFSAKSTGMRMGGGASPFGIDAERVPDAVDEARRAGLRIEGFHVFTSSQSLDAAALCESNRKKLELMLEISNATSVQPRVLNIGGGLGIPYLPGDQPLDVERVCENLHELSRIVEARAPQATLVLELGRYLVGEAGIYVCRVIDRKVSRGSVFLVTDGGMHHHLAAAGLFGQVVRRNFPVAIGNRMRGERREVASVVGPLCTPLDLLADKADLAEAREGDFVVVFQSGAYGLTASPTAFLSHPAPAEILV